MSQSFRQRALIEMGFSPWIARHNLAATAHDDAVLLDAPPQRGAAASHETGANTLSRTPVRSLEAFGLRELLPLMQACAACERANTRRAVALPQGPARAKLMVIEQAPAGEASSGDKTHAANVQRLFEQMLFSLGLALPQVYTTHFVRCDGDTPSDSQMAACSPYLKREIELIGPRALLAFEPLTSEALRAMAPHCEVLALPHPRELLGHGGTKKAAWLKLLQLKSFLAAIED